VPDKNPRTEWACQPVAAISSASVAPSLRPRSKSTSADFVLLDRAMGGLWDDGRAARFVVGAFRRRDGLDVFYFACVAFLA